MDRKRAITPLFSTLSPAALALVLLLLLAGCGRQSISTAPVIRPHTPEVKRSSPATQKQAAILRTARSMMGARYKWGGSSPREGFDCSGLVWFVYGKNGVKLPRVSWQQFGAGHAVGYREMRPGDLIFHKVDKGSKSLHVGIVTDRGTFIHAPSSGKRVMESSLSNSYWLEHYIGARRVL